MADTETIAPPSSPRPTCAACDTPAVVQWQRRGGEDPEGTSPVYACPAHAITLNAAARIHQATCPAPDPALLPACGCTPEPLAPEEPMTAPTTTLPTGWVIPAT